MKYTAALLTLAIATPALAQTSAEQIERNQFNSVVCGVRGICDEAGQNAAWEAVENRKKDLGAVGPVKGPIVTAGAAKAATNAATTRASSSNAAKPARGPAARSGIPRRKAPFVAPVPSEVKGDSPLMVTFASNSARLTRDSRAAVSGFAQALRLDEAMGKLDSKFLIEGHTDSVGADDFNQELSQKRAQAVVDALVGMGFDAERFIVEGKGEAEPLEGRRGRDPLNRRVIAKAID